MLSLEPSNSTGLLRRTNPTSHKVLSSIVEWYNTVSTSALSYPALTKDSIPKMTSANSKKAWEFRPLDTSTHLLKPNSNISLNLSSSKSHLGRMDSSGPRLKAYLQPSSFTTFWTKFYADAVTSCSLRFYRLSSEFSIFLNCQAQLRNP